MTSWLVVVVVVVVGAAVVVGVCDVVPVAVTAEVVEVTEGTQGPALTPQETETAKSRVKNFEDTMLMSLKGTALIIKRMNGLDG